MNAPEDPNGLRAALARAEAENRKLREKINQQKRDVYQANRWYQGFQARALAAEAEITRLKEGMEAAVGALKPFATGADIADADCLKCFADLRYMDEQEIDPILPSGEAPVLATLGDFRRARSALATLSPKEQP